jgi:translation initiation factor IF-2
MREGNEYMAKKVHELAKELGIASKDIVAFLAEKGIDKKAGSNLEESEIKLVNGKFGKQEKKEIAPAPEKKAEPAKKAESTEKKPEAVKAPVKPAEKPAPERKEADEEDNAPKRLKPVSIDGAPVLMDGRKSAIFSHGQQGAHHSKPVQGQNQAQARPGLGKDQRQAQRPQGQGSNQPQGQNRNPQRPVPQGGQRFQNPQDKKIEIPKGKAPTSSYKFGDTERQKPQPQQQRPLQPQKPEQKAPEVKPVQPEKTVTPEQPKFGQDFLINKNQSTIVIKGNVFDDIKKREEERQARRAQSGLDARPGQPSARNDRRVPTDRGQGQRPQGDRRFTPRDGQKPDSSYRQGQPGDRPRFGGQGQGKSFGARPGGQMSGFVPKDGDEPSHSYKAGKNDRNTSRKPGAAADISAKGNSSNKRNERLAKNKTFESGKNYDDDNLKGSKKKDAKRAGAFQKPVAKAVQQEDDIKVITIPDMLTIKELADHLKKNASDIIKKLFMQGKMVSLNQDITFEEAEDIASEYDCLCEHEVKVNVIEELMRDIEDPEDSMVQRPPVVCVMGHVDHGKTSLLDAIRSTNVTAREAGGITQHIGASVIEINNRKITFLDTPGHEAFTSMRLRGAKSTDIAILVVAADDGVMPQTIEAINHAKAAGIQIIVAVNKIDKPAANIDKVKQELTEYGLVAEDWGGDTIFAPVSAKTHEGIEGLLEMVLLTSDMLELKANPNRKARGIVIEAELDKGRGPVATILVQKGTLHQGDIISIGAAFGKVRAMTDDKGRRVKEATPSTPVEIIGLNAVPGAGDTFIVTGDEKEARTIADAFVAEGKEQLIADTRAKLSLDGLYSQIKAGNIKELNVIIKADVQGSVEAMKQSLLKLSNDEVAIRVIHSGVGAINESDVNLASASNAIMIGFNVKPDNTAKDIAEHEKVDIRLYRVIYNAIEDIEKAMQGMLDPIYEEKIVGHAEIRQIFKASGIGNIAGSFVLDGKVMRNASARITRGSDLIWEGPVASLKRMKDDVKEVAAGYECGIVFEKFNDFAELDIAEFYIMVEVPRK